MENLLDINRADVIHLLIIIFILALSKTSSPTSVPARARQTISNELKKKGDILLFLASGLIFGTERLGSTFYFYELVPRPRLWCFLGWLPEIRF